MGIHQKYADKYMYLQRQGINVFELIIKLIQLIQWQEQVSQNDTCQEWIGFEVVNSHTTYMNMYR